MHGSTGAGPHAGIKAAQPPSEFLTKAALRNLRRIADQIAGTDVDPIEVEAELLADIDAAIFDAQHDLVHRGDQTARRRIRILNRQRDQISRTWHKAVGHAEYHAAKLDELAEAPDAATAADAVARWGLLDARRVAKPLPPATPPFAMPTATDKDLHAALDSTIRQFFADADVPGAKPRLLVVAQTGGRKTGLSLVALRAAIEARKEAGRPWRAVWFVPEHRLSAEALKRARAAGLHAAILHGRSERSCRNMEAVKLAQGVGADVKRTVCGPTREGQCAFRNWCGQDGYFAGLAMAADADLIIVAHNYLTEPLPEVLRANLAFAVVDEDFADLVDRERHITRETLTAEPLERSPVRDDQGQPDRAATDELARHCAVIYRAIGACVGGYVTADALREAGFLRLDMARTRTLIWRREIRVQMYPGQDPEARKEAARLAAVNGQLPGLVGLTYALEKVATGDPAAAGLVSVRLDERRGGSQVMIEVRGQREPAAWVCDLPVLMLSATGRIEDVRRFFRDAKLAEIERAAEPYDTVHQIIGGFGQSTLARHKTRLTELRDFAILASMGRDSALVVTHKATEDHFAGIPGLATAHHGAIVGHDAHRTVDVAFIVGGTFASPRDIASLAAARGGGAVVAAKPVWQTGAALLKDGSAVEIPVLRYEDEAAQAAHQGLYLRSIVQAAGRPRPLERTNDNSSIRYVFANVELPFPVDSVSHWRDGRGCRPSA
ncbi:MAG: hypothetical protein ACJ8AW_25670, partial [Rhodopila sp.]